MTSVLLLDDDKIITDPLACALTQAGCRVMVAHNGREGLALASKKSRM